MQVDTVYPVNALAFHPKWGTFATGGCDGASDYLPIHLSIYSTIHPSIYLMAWW